MKDLGRLGMVTYSSTQEAEADGFLGVQGQPGLHSEFQDNQQYVETLL